MVHKSLDRVRQYVAGSLGEVDLSKHSLSWVTGKTASFDCVPINKDYPWPEHMAGQWKNRDPNALLVSAFLLGHPHVFPLMLFAQHVRCVLSSVTITQLPMWHAFYWP